MRPKVSSQRAKLGAQLLRPLGIVDGALDFLAVTDNAAICEAPLYVFLGEGCHLVHVEIGEGCAKILAFFQDRVPAQP